MTARRFWPVIHAESYEQAARNVDLAADAGAHGVFLINMAISESALAHIIGRLPVTDIAIGANWLGLTNAEAQEASEDYGLAAFWTDSADDYLSPIAGLEWFGGVAHKGNPWVYDADLPFTAAASVTVRRIDVPTMTGTGTGVAAEPHRCKMFRSGLSADHRLGLASGITPDNAWQYLPFVTDYLAATGIQLSFTELDPLLTKRLARAIG